MFVVSGSNLDQFDQILELCFVFIILILVRGFLWLYCSFLG